MEMFIMYEYRILNRSNDMAKDILDTIKNNQIMI